MTGAGIRQPQPCGTEAAYQRHRRHGEVADEACLIAARGMRRMRHRWRKLRGQVDQEYMIGQVVRVLADALLWGTDLAVIAGEAGEPATELHPPGSVADGQRVPAGGATTSTGRPIPDALTSENSELSTC